MTAGKHRVVRADVGPLFEALCAVVHSLVEAARLLRRELSGKP